MRISDLRTERQGDRHRVCATVHWEDCDQLSRDVYIETDAQHAPALMPSPHAFLVGCLPPAMHFGERRVALDQEVCPTLLEGLHTAMAVLHQWYGSGFRPLSLETGGAAVPAANGPRRAGLFLSGGIDSLAALRLNRLHFPPDHPGFIKDCLLVHGFDIGGVVERGPKPHVFERALEHMQVIARDAGAELIPVYTNFRHLCDQRELWLEKFFGAVLAAVGHAFSSRLHLAYIASSYDLPNLVPCGSHPLLDPQYSSFGFAIRHRDLEFSRVDKIRLIREWDAGFQNLRVCLRNAPDRLNCGTCEKCVRTMLALVGLGALGETKAFVENDVHPDMLSGFEITIRHREPFYLELLPLLEEQGRFDLSRAIRNKLR